MKEQSLDSASVSDGLSNTWDHGLGHIHGFAPSPGAQGQQPGGVLIAAGAGGAVFANAGFIDLGQGAFSRRPEGGDLPLPFLLGWGMLVHAMYV